MNVSRALVVLLVVVLVVGAAPAAWSLSTSTHIQDDVPVSTPQTPTITLSAPNSADVNLRDYAQGSQMVLNTSEGNMTVTGDPSGAATIAVADIEGTQTQLTNIQAGASWINVNPSDKQRVDVRGDADTLAFEQIAADDSSTDIQIGGPQGGTAELRLHGLAANTDYALYDASRDEVLETFTTDGSGVGQTNVGMPDGTQALEVRTAGSFGQPSASNGSPTGTIDERPSGLEADVSADAYPATVTIDFEGETVATQTITQSTRVNTTNISVDSEGTFSYSVTVDDAVDQTTTYSESFTVDVPDPSVSNPQPSGQLNERATNLSVDAVAYDYPATVTFVLDNETVGTETVSQNGTVTTKVERKQTLGSHEWNATVSDYVNQTDTTSATFTTPDEITIREEGDPQQVITNSTATLRFFTVDGEVAVERDVVNGTVDMAGLPDTEFVAVIDSPNHYTRTIFIESIYEQDNMFLLNQTRYPRSQNEAVRSRFLYEDLTGKYPNDVTTIQVQRAIDVNGDNTSQFRVVAGDFWGASNEFEQVFERGARYRIVLVNRETGQRNIAGTHIPTEELTQTIRVSGLIEEAANATGVTGIAEYNASAQQIELAYTDPIDQTDSLRVKVVSQGGNQTLLNETVDGPLGTYQTAIALNDSQAEKNWIVQYDAGARHRSAIPVGSGSIGLPVTVPGWLLTLLMTMGVTFVGALYGPRTALLGAWAMVMVAGGVAMFGWAFSGASVLVAGLVATAATFVARAVP